MLKVNDVVVIRNCNGFLGDVKAKHLDIMSNLLMSIGIVTEVSKVPDNMGHIFKVDVWYGEGKLGDKDWFNFYDFNLQKIGVL